MSHDILFEVIGNTSAFSLMGESSGYMITVNNRVYLRGRVGRKDSRIRGVKQ